MEQSKIYTKKKRTLVTCCWKTEEILKLQKCHHFKLHCAISLFPRTFNQCRKNLTGEAAKNHSEWRKNWLWIVMFWHVALFEETYSLYILLIFKALWINQKWNLIPFTRNGSTEIRIFFLSWFWCFKYFLAACYCTWRLVAVHIENHTFKQQIYVFNQCLFWFY